MNTESPALLKSKDIAAIYNVTDREVTKWHAAGIIPSEIHVGRVIRFDAATTAAASHRASALIVGAPTPDGDDYPAIDGLFIFPAPQEKRRDDGFTEFSVSAYGRTSDVFQESSRAEDQRIGDLISYKLMVISGAMVIPTGIIPTVFSIGINEAMPGPFNVRSNGGRIPILEPGLLGPSPYKMTYSENLLWRFSDAVEDVSMSGDGFAMDYGTGLLEYGTTRVYWVTATWVGTGLFVPDQKIAIVVSDPTIKTVALRSFGKFTEVELSTNTQSFNLPPSLASITYP